MKKILITILILFTGTSLADEATGWGSVTEIWSGYKGGLILFKLDIAHINPKSCTGSGFYSVNPSTSDADHFLSMLLTAKSTGNPVKIMLSSTECYYNYPTALRMGVK
jgi:hypothetical protein